ncbi:hypothetical protein [uncultured Faecalibaculum sp.]|uniref:hypothetical protein n=1 Tax=uncultured Faecalibaculum sp. TaxID=1729681 RepID=UPI0025E3255A|nr:hypothetical protein [uncultured Faecalibaculum sp.]
MDILILFVFILGIVISQITGFSVLWILAGFCLLLILYALSSGFRTGDLPALLHPGCLTACRLGFLFLLIGGLNGLWRSCGVMDSLASLAGCCLSFRVSPAVWIPAGS